MAKYEDYVKRQAENDDLQREIDEAGEQESRRQAQLPERFRNKSAEEIAQSYVELERKFNERNDAMGDLRRQVDELVALETVRQTQPEPDPEPVTVDDFYEDVEGTIASVVERRTSKKIEELERQVAESKQQAALREFESLHPNWREEAQSPEFQEWVNASSYRQRLVQQADKYDFDAANDLFEMYHDSHRKQREERDEKVRSRQLRDAELESGGAEAYDTEPRFSRREIINHKIQAKHGNTASQDWLRDNGDAIAIAYEEGQVTD